MVSPLIQGHRSLSFLWHADNVRQEANRDVLALARNFELPALEDSDGAARKAR